MIPYGRQDISQADIDAVVRVLQSDFLTQGPAVPAFEEKLRSYCGAQHAVAVNSATSALHIACLALGLKEGDWLWTTPITFVASANCARYCGAQVDFIDVDADTFNMSVEALEAKLIAAEREGRLPKIVIPVHLCGQSCDMAAISALAKRFDFRVIEDASHAIGASYRGTKVGACEFSDITVFSFHPVKIITSAEGGMAVTNDAALATRMELLRSHGITRDANLMHGQSDGPWYYQQITLGFNYRMTDLQAALGVSQMDRLDAYVERRQTLARQYDDLLEDLPLTHQVRPEAGVSALHLYVIKLDDAARRRPVFEALRAQGVGVNVHYIPVHLQPDYQQFGFVKGQFPVAEAYYDGAISLPLYPGLTDEQQRFVVDTLRAALA